MRRALDRGVVIRAVVSVVLVVENTLDAADASDVAAGVAAIRDQGGVFSDVLRKSPKVWQTRVRAIADDIVS
jgi:hypothetical protein